MDIFIPVIQGFAVAALLEAAGLRVNNYRWWLAGFGIHVFIYTLT